MLCRSCKRDIPENSVFCNWCGAKQLMVRKKRDIVTVPEPKQLPSGTWFVQFKFEGERYSTSAATKELCKAKAIAIKSDLIKAKRAPFKLTLKDACKRYISDRSAVLSPSTISGYQSILDTRFTRWLSTDIFSEPNWQSMVNEEALLCAPKTLKNAWGFIAAVLSSFGVEAKVNLPQIARKELPWLDYEQIITFLNALEGTPGELAALLALHSLRKSEILGLTAENIDLDSKTIYIHGSAVRGANNKLVLKETNKNSSSQRVVPIVIPRLETLLRAHLSSHPEGRIITCAPGTIYDRVNTVCANAGLPLIGVHGLRRSFASLAYHLGWSELDTMRVGGWSDFDTMRRFYTKLAEKDLTASVQKMSDFYAKNDVSPNETPNADSKSQWYQPL